MSVESPAVPPPAPGGDGPAPPGASQQPPVSTGAPHPVGKVPADAADPQVAEQIRQVRERLQSQDPAVQARVLAALNCTDPNPLRGNDDPNLPLITCNRDHTVKYLLGPAFMSGEQVSHASAGVNADGTGYEVRLKFNRQGDDIWARYTANNVGRQVAFLLDSEVLSAPQIRGAIPPGSQTSITGSFTQAEAQNLANAIK